MPHVAWLSCGDGKDTSCTSFEQIGEALNREEALDWNQSPPHSPSTPFASWRSSEVTRSSREDLGPRPFIIRR